MFDSVYNYAIEALTYRKNRNYRNFDRRKISLGIESIPIGSGIQEIIESIIRRSLKWWGRDVCEIF